MAARSIRHDLRDCPNCLAELWHRSGAAAPARRPRAGRRSRPAPIRSSACCRAWCSAAPAGASPSWACRLRARPAPPTTTSTPGSSASARTWRSVFSSASTSRGPSAPRTPAPTSRRPCSRPSWPRPWPTSRPSPFRIPPGIRLVRMNAETGQLARPGRQPGGLPGGLPAGHRAFGPSGGPRRRLQPTDRRHGRQRHRRAVLALFKQG